MKRIYRKLKLAYDKKVDATGLAVFRIAYSLVLLCDVIQLFYFRHLIFDKVPYLRTSEIDFTIPLLSWMVVILLITFGLFTKTATILNYLFSLIFIATIDTYEYHMFYVYVGVNFLLMFTSISRVISLDKLRLKLKHSNTKITYNPSRTTSVLNYFVILLVGIGLVYFDSIFYKFVSPMWLNGLGVWLPSSLGQMANVDTSVILNQKWLVIILSYLTLGLETVFIFTFFRKTWRIPIFFLGIGLHLGIVVQFPIPLFGLGFISIYLLMMPLKWWSWFNATFKFKKSRLTFYYDEECPLCNRTKIILSHFDILEAIQFKGFQTYAKESNHLKFIAADDLLGNIHSVTYKWEVLCGVKTYRYAFLQLPLLFPFGILLFFPGVYHFCNYIYGIVARNGYVDRCTEENCGFTPAAFPKNTDDIKLTNVLTYKDFKIAGVSLGVILLFVLQLNVITHSTAILKGQDWVGLNKQSISYRMFNKVSYKIFYLSKTFLGISSHAVFIDSHFVGYNHTIAVVYTNGEKKEWLPITDPDGSLGSWQIGPIWAKWGFRGNSALINQFKLNQTIRDFTAFWAYKNKVSLENARFEILVKRNEDITEWESDVLINQLSQPWINAGFVQWENKKFESKVMDIETLK
jgi:hypothetical protein